MANFKIGSLILLLVCFLHCAVSEPLLEQSAEGREQSAESGAQSVESGEQSAESGAQSAESGAQRAEGKARRAERGEQRAERMRQRLIEVAVSQLHVRELTGNNDGKEVERYLRAVGLGKGYAWCAAFVAWCHDEVGIPNPQSAWSPSWFSTNVVYRRNQPRIEPYQSRGGEVVGFYYEHLKRVGHVGIIEEEHKLHYITIEGNTNSAGSREGDGVYRKIRKKESIYVIADYAGYYEIREAGRRKTGDR